MGFLAVFRLVMGVLVVARFGRHDLGVDFAEAGALGFGVGLALTTLFPFPFRSLIKSSSDPSDVVDRRWGERISSHEDSECFLRCSLGLEVRAAVGWRTCLRGRDSCPQTLSGAYDHGILGPALLAIPGGFRKRPLLSV